MSKNLLPIGSVVSLKGAEKKLMIIGNEMISEDDEKTFDYMGIPFPEGFINSEMIFLFMNEDVENVHFFGFVNQETQLYMAQINSESEDLDTDEDEDPETEV